MIEANEAGRAAALCKGCAKMKKCMATVLTVLLLLTGCAKGPEPSETVPVTQTSPSTAPVTTAPEITTPETTAPEPAGLDPLTGQALEAPYDNSRPYAVMVNNIKVAQPQCGISQADILYEVLAEGGITRTMAIFSTMGDQPLGSIRSLRPYYLSIARAYDAIVVHAGGSEQAYSDLSSSGWDHIDGVRGANSGSYYYRVQSRIDTAGYEHSLFIDGDDVREYATYMDCRFLHDEDYSSGLSFSQDPMEQGDPATAVTVHFRTSKTTSFEYDSQTGLYSASQYDKAYADGNNDETLTFRNLLVLYAETKTVDDYGRLAVTLTGQGEGYLVRDGKCISILWSRTGEDEPFRYTSADGTPVDLGVGKTYVGVTPPGSDLDLA